MSDGDKEDNSTYTFLQEMAFRLEPPDLRHSQATAVISIK
jgi:hypothetical protein